MAGLVTTSPGSPSTRLQTVPTLSGCSRTTTLPTVVIPVDIWFCNLAQPPSFGSRLTGTLALCHVWSWVGVLGGYRRQRKRTFQPSLTTNADANDRFSSLRRPTTVSALFDEERPTNRTTWAKGGGLERRRSDVSPPQRTPGPRRREGGPHRLRPGAIRGAPPSLSWKAADTGAGGASHARRRTTTRRKRGRNWAGPRRLPITVPDADGNDDDADFIGFSFAPLEVPWNNTESIVEEVWKQQ